VSNNTLVCIKIRRVFVEFSTSITTGGNSVKGECLLTSWTTISFSIRTLLHVIGQLAGFIIKLLTNYVAQEPEGSSPHPQQSATGPCPECVVIRNKYWVLRGRVVSLPHNPQAGGPPTVGCPRLLIQYIGSYPPYLEAVSSIRNPRNYKITISFILKSIELETGGCDIREYCDISSGAQHPLPLQLSAFLHTWNNKLETYFLKISARKWHVCQWKINIYVNS
jgi:hypothetical protein